MPMTLEQLRNQLSAIEPNDHTFAGIGPTEIPLLEQLLQDEEVWMASRAVFALSRLSNNLAIKILSKAATDPRPEVRVSVAASLNNLQLNAANSLLQDLLTDENVGVRKFSVKAVSDMHGSTVHSKLGELQNEDPEPVIRELAMKKIQEIDQS